MCGAEEELFLTEVEGTRLNACKNCCKFGKVMNKIKKEPEREQRNEIGSMGRNTEIIQGFIPDFNKLIKEKRERLNLKQKELAKVIAEKESVIHKLESGIEPNLELARKIERFLKINIIEEQEIKKTEIKTNSGEFTIGDIIKIKKRKS